MPLILELDGWSRERVREELRGYQAAFGKLAETFDRPPPEVPNSWAAELAANLCRQSVALADQLLGLEGIPPPLGAAAVNQLYELQNAIPYLLRASQLAPPAFPSRRGAAAAPPAAVDRAPRGL